MSESHISPPPPWGRRWSKLWAEGRPSSLGRDCPRSQGWWPGAPSPDWDTAELSMKKWPQSGSTHVSHCSRKVFRPFLQQGRVWSHQENTRDPDLIDENHRIRRHLHRQISARPFLLWRENTGVDNNEISFRQENISKLLRCKSTGNTGQCMREGGRYKVKYNFSSYI